MGTLLEAAAGNDPMPSTAAQRRAQRFAEFKRQREQEEQEHRDTVIAEFRADPRAMADEIRRLRRGLAQMAKVVGWMQVGRPFTVIGPGPASPARRDNSERTWEALRRSTSARPKTVIAR
jgi:hypothetical protein